MFWHTVEISASQINESIESFETAGTKDLEADEAKELLQDGGVLGQGFRAAVPGLADAKAVAFAEAFNKTTGMSGSGPAKVRKVEHKPDEPVAEEPEEPTIQDLAKDKMAEMLIEIREGSGYASTLLAHGLCKDLAADMKKHSHYMDEKYGVLAAMNKANKDVDDYVLVFSEIEEKQKFWKENADTCKKMSAHARNAGAKAKAKGKAKAKAKEVWGQQIVRGTPK